MRKVMKKAATATLLSAAVALSIPAFASAAASSPIVSLNGKPLPLTGSYISDGRTYVNIAELSELFGLPYTLDTQAGTLSVNGKPLPIQLKGGVPFAPVRELSAAAGAEIRWNKAANTVQITFGEQGVSENALVVYGDTVQMGSCLVMNRFIPGDAIVFRMKATDSATGQLAEGAKLQVHLSTGEVLDMQLGDHPPEVPGADRFWSAKYEVTEDTPKGTLNYRVTAQSGDKKGEFKPFNVVPSLLTIVSPDQLVPATDVPASEPAADGEA
ncbi:hypothetical protein [Cohnella cellulosilytica]|uniref:Copper amine oxidase-like N-terminal domain-containing protein n=1 Tax=Cohnella cellulosilytica TaxID=986710 RepID=A0ABW2FC79_9BACL